MVRQISLKVFPLGIVLAAISKFKQNSNCMFLEMDVPHEKIVWHIHLCLLVVRLSYLGVTSIFGLAAIFSTGAETDEGSVGRKTSLFEIK